MELKQINLAGIYVIAVSGGIDSVVLLSLLHKNYPKNTFIVAHFDHGIRTESNEDAKFVESLAEKYNLKFEVGTAKLGSNASESQARDARYAFLKQVREKYSAEAIITAHHQDDVLETMIINLLRGTSWRGLAPMVFNNEISRPLLDIPKTEIIKYAISNNLEWREDVTNRENRYLRNRVRNNLIPFLGGKRAELLHINKSLIQLIPKIDKELSRLSNEVLVGNNLDRQQFLMFPHTICKLILRSWFIGSDVQNIDSRMLDDATIAIKSLGLGKNFALDKTKHLRISSRQSVTIVSSN